jgi:glycosyltransferase involved in cell wall biosynthesis
LSKKILIVASYFPPTVIGGAEIVAYRQAKLLIDQGYQVSVFTRDRSRNATSNGVATTDIVDGLPVTRVAPTAAGEYDFLIPEIDAQFDVLLGTLAPDLVHFHHLAGLGASLVTRAKARRVKSVATLHSAWGFCLLETLIRNGAVCQHFDQCAGCRSHIPASHGVRIPSRFRNDYVRWCLSNVDLMISPSAWLKSSYRKAGLDSGIATLSNGIDLGAIEPVLRKDQSPVHFLFAGVLADHKGVRYLLDAAAKLLAEGDLHGRWSLTIAGDGPDEQMVVDRLREFRTDAVSWIGRVPRYDLLRRLPHYDVVVLPSVGAENEPVTLLEAMASGAAQLATAVGGSVELIEHGESGFLVPPSDATSLAEAMRRMINDPGLVHRFSARNLARRAGFDEAETIRRLIEIYDVLDLQDVKVDDLIICVGGMPPPEIASLLNSHGLRANTQNAATLIWHEWATPYEWRKARAVWSWEKNIDAGCAMQAGARRLPILAPEGAGLDGERATSADLVTYRDAAEAIAYIDGLG